MAAVGASKQLAASKYFNKVADSTGAMLQYTNAQAYQTKAAAEAAEIQADAKTAVSTSIGKSAQTIAKANEQQFNGWLQVVDGG